MAYTNLTSRRRGLNEEVYSFGDVGLGRDFTSFTTWSITTGGNLVTDQRSVRLEIYDDKVYTERWNSGNVADANDDFFRTITPAGVPGTASWQGHTGIPGTGVRLRTAAPEVVALNINEPGLRVYDMDILLEADTGVQATSVLVSSGARNIHLVGCLLSASNIGSGGDFPVRSASPSPAYIRNCIIYGGQIGVLLAGTAGQTFVGLENCTVVKQSSISIFAQTGDVEAYNVLAEAGGADLAQTGTAGFLTGDYLATTDATSSLYASTTSFPNEVFSYRDEASSDYRLTFDDTGALNRGRDPVFFSAFPYDDDIDNIVVKEFSIGADSLNSAMVLASSIVDHIWQVDSVLKRRVVEIPTVSENFTSLDYAVPLDTTAGVIDYIRISSENSVEIDFEFYDEEGNYVKGVHNILSLTAISGRYEQERVNVLYRNVVPYIYVIITNNDNTLETGVITVEIGAK